MNRAGVVILGVFCLMFSWSPAEAQSVIAGGGILNHIPVGGLRDRYENSAGGSAYVGQMVNANWTWVGKIDYAQFTKLNTPQYKGTVSYVVGKTSQALNFPLDASLLSMKLTTTGFIAEAKYNIVRSRLLESNMNFGFGFTYWEQIRKAYTDTIMVDTSVGAVGKFAGFPFSVVENKQTDWSGTINVGVEAVVKILPSLSVVAGADYKMIIGELWPMLAMHQENVSGMQMIIVRGGIRFDL
jgi:hypothetical protein